jgi:hypothetical protein
MTSDPDQLPLFGPRDGDTFDPDQDTSRLNRQARDVWLVMADQQWHTLHELAIRTGHPEASISARLRDLRKPRFGSRQIEREHWGHGLHAYRYVPPGHE